MIHARHRRAFSLIGMLLTMVCMVVLFVIGMSALNKAVTGEGSPLEGTVNSTQDLLTLTALHQSMFVYAMEHRDDFLVPSAHADSGDTTQDTTASLFSAMVMDHRFPTDQLVSGNEYSTNVWADDDYDHNLYDPRSGVYWDPSFEADLDSRSNVSFAHVPLFGTRRDRLWSTRADAQVPILGFRGPENGEDRPDSWTYGRNGAWGGYILFGDGHVEWLDTFTPASVTRAEGGAWVPDNIFSMEEGPGGKDAVLAFTKRMLRDGPELQWD